MLDLGDLHLEICPLGKAMISQKARIREKKKNQLQAKNATILLMKEN